MRSIIEFLKEFVAFALLLALGCLVLAEIGLRVYDRITAQPELPYRRGMTFVHLTDAGNRVVAEVLAEALSRFLPID